jgi:hypothetical protein
LVEVKTETERCFSAEQMRKQKFPLPTNTEFLFYVFYMANLAGPICELVILYCQSNLSLLS